MTANNKPASSPFDSRPLLWCLGLAFLAIWFYMLGARTLVPTDEGRYAEMAREMVATGDWITPRLNAIKYFEKPPLQNWMNALSFELFGLGDWQARLWTGLTGLLGIALSAYAATKLFGRRIGVSTALVLASSFYWAAFGHINSLDMGLSGMTTLALCGLLVAQREGASARENLLGMLACWAGMALAVLSKGLIGVVLPGAVLVLYTLATRDWKLWTRLHMGKGLLLFFAITVPWFVLVAQKNPEHPHFFFIHEHWERFTSKVHHRGGAWYYFFPFLIIGILPWLGMLVQGLLEGSKERAAAFRPKLMLLIWTVFFFLFFSVSGSKLPSYIVPIFPSLAMLLACYLERAKAKTLTWNALILAAIGIIGLACAWKIPGMAGSAFEVPLYEKSLPWVYAAAFTITAGGLWAAWLASSKGGERKDLSIVVLAATAFLGGQLPFMGIEPWGQYSAGLPYVKAIQEELKPGVPLYAVGRYEQSLPYYLRHTVILVEHPDEMQFGLEIEPQLWLPKRADFLAKWKADNAEGKPALAILRTDIYEEMRQQGYPMRIIAQDPKRVIVSNQLQH
jgi:4-amino-4-deoxy-L-arabinose transferase-like glycosyltransferase